VFASQYPLLDVFWTIFMVFAFVIWIWVLIAIFSDLFRSHDVSGFGKALWVIFIIVFPLIGILAYLIVRGHGMHERAVTQANQQKQEFDAYVRQTAGTNTADELTKLGQLKDNGTITQAEFDAQKAKLLA
jgi:ABC-type transport system involved in multi-copper enzyme maturation permease subunit